MPNDSSTGGYLVPSSNNDLNDQALDTFLQAIVVGIVGLPGPMVRPRWQAEPPTPPSDPTVNWAAIGPGSRKRDKYSAAVHIPTGNGSVKIIRNREMDVLCSFYGANAEGNAELLAMGLEVPQNREAMTLQGFNLISGAGDSIPAPSLFKQIWYRKFDISFRLRQQQQYTYPVLNLLGAVGTLTAEEGSNNTTVNIAVTQPA
jgi:hypothetical protein